MLLAPSKCLFKWINMIISKSIHGISKIIFILRPYKFLACLECISRNGLSFAHLDWDPSSVYCMLSSIINVIFKVNLILSGMASDKVVEVCCKWSFSLFHQNLKYHEPRTGSSFFYYGKSGNGKNMSITNVIFLPCEFFLPFRCHTT